MRLARAPAAAHAFVSERFEAERERLRHAETAHLPLAGLAVSVKDLLMWQGKSLQQVPSPCKTHPPQPAMRPPWHACGPLAAASSGARTWWNSLSPASAPTHISQRPPRSTIALAPCPGQRGYPAGLPPGAGVRSPQWRVLRSVGLRRRGSRFAFLPRSTALLVSKAQPGWSPPLAPCRCPPPSTPPAP